MVSALQQRFDLRARFRSERLSPKPDPSPDPSVVEQPQEEQEPVLQTTPTAPADPSVQRRGELSAQIEEKKARIAEINARQAEIVAKRQNLRQGVDYFNAQGFRSVKGRLEKESRAILGEKDRLQEQVKNLQQARARDVSVGQVVSDKNRFEAQERSNAARQEKARIEAEKQAFIAGKPVQPGEKAPPPRKISAGIQPSQPTLTNRGGAPIIVRDPGQTAFQAIKAQGKTLPRVDFSQTQGAKQIKSVTPIQKVNVQTVSASGRSSVSDLSASQRDTARTIDGPIRRTGDADRVLVSNVSSVPSSKRFTPGGVISAGTNKPLKIFGVVPTGLTEDIFLQRLKFRQQNIAFLDNNPRKAAEADIKGSLAGARAAALFPVTKTGEFVEGLVQFAKSPVSSTKATLQAFGRDPAGVGGEFIGSALLFKGAFKTVGVAKDVSTVGVTAASTKFRPAIPSGVSGQTGALSTIENIPTSKGPVQIKIVGGIGSKTLPSETVSQQAGRAGTTVDAVSAARDLFVINRQVVVDKPLPTPSSPPLERSFFADPSARLRPSRLGLTQAEQRATLADIATGNFQLFRQRPQAVLFPETPVQAFPKSLADVQASLLANKPLTPAQQQRLLAFQLERSGQFKPVGFLSTEPEITLAPGEVIRVVPGQGAVTLLPRQGKSLPSVVDVFEARIVKPSDVRAGDTILAPKGTSVPAGVRRVSPRPAPKPLFPVSSALAAPAALAGTSAVSTTRSSFRPAIPSLINFSAPARAQGTSQPASGSAFQPAPGSPGAASPSTSPTGFSTFTSPRGTSPVGGSPAGSARGVSPVTSAPRPPVTLFTPPKPPKLPKPRTDSGRLTRGFKAFARVRGEFEPVSGALSRQRAFLEGFKFVDTTPSATFELRPTDELVSDDPVASSEIGRALSQLRAPGRKGVQGSASSGLSRYVEKSRFRIDTPGEKERITFEGLRTLRGRRR